MTLQRLAAYTFLAIAAAGFVYAAVPDDEFPDPTLTPGAVATADRTEICTYEHGLSYSKRHRATAPETKREVIFRYGLHPPFQGEIDHRVPLCLGGADTTANLWPQRDFRAKDELEAWTCRAVCAGRVELGTAQGWFLGDWRAELWRVGR